MPIRQEEDPMSGGEVVYLLFRFPNLTETFVAEEIRHVQKLGTKVRLFSLLRPRKELVHPVSAELLPLVRYAPELYSPSILWAQLHFLLKTPTKYLGALGVLLGEPVSSFSLVIRRLVIFFKAVWIARQLEHSSVQLVHTHFAWLSAAACMVVHHLLGLPFTATAHAFDIYSPRNDLLRLTARSANRLVTISEYNKQAILDLLAKTNGKRAAPIDVIHCGIDLSSFRPSGEKAASSAFEIVSVGRMIETKGHEYLIQACALLNARGFDFRCTVVGGGYRKPSLEALVRELCLEDRVHLVGTRSQSWVRDRLAQSDMFALACVVAGAGERDGIPVSIMEALAMELPVVSTPVSGIPELIQHEHTGLLVPERDADALAGAIARLIGDEDLRRRLARNGRALVQREYDISQTARQMVELFKRVNQECGR
jgi:colanic acid/amylovoran biosynthesis glycosyltransferase